MKKNIVILGATGTVGSKIAQILINEGHHVTLEDVNVLHLRSAYFMENFLRTIGLVKQAGINGTVAAGNHAIPMVATRDVAQVAAAHLANLDFSGKSVHAVMGPRDYTYSELTSIVGNAIGKPDLAYVQLPVEKVREVFLGNGFSPDFITNLIEMGTAISTGYMNYQKRDESTTTATTAAEFAIEVYAPAFQR